jgi:hypothetical protein
MQFKMMNDTMMNDEKRYMTGIMNDAVGSSFIANSQALIIHHVSFIIHHLSDSF